MCEELCGMGHYNMRGHVVVDEEPAFKDWLSTYPTYAQTLAGEDPATATGAALSLTEQGRELATKNACLVCHSLDGSTTIGPTWKGLFGKTETLADGSTIVVDDEYLKESILQPNAKLVKGYAPTMPPVSLTEAELETLISFIKDGPE